MPPIHSLTSMFTKLLLLVSLLVATNVIAQTNSKVYSKFNINRISTYIFNDGIADIQPNGNSGFEFPKGSKKAVNYSGGFIWGGKIDGKINAGGSAYRAGLKPGKILSNGKADDPESKSARIFKVRNDFRYADLNMEAIDENKTVQAVFSQYEKDWDEWPTRDGAPYDDVNKDGSYQPGIDIPGIPGANQTLWFVANDLDSNQTKYFSGALPIGIEIQVTIWGYKYDDSYRSNALFKRYIVINKGQKEIKEMHFGIWADPDVGDAGDDLVGCDTTLNMCYTFNSDNSDATYSSNPPAFGYTLLQGPIIDGTPNDKAIFKNRIIFGKKNLQMSALGWILKNTLDWSDPTFAIATTAGQLYNFLMGKSRSGLDWQIPARLGGGITKFPFSGDYVRKTGYYDGVEYSPMDRRMMLCVGPFNMAVGDTQEVVFMESAAGADGVSTNLEAIDLLKADAASAISNYSHVYKYYTNPARLQVKTINLDRQVEISWGDDLEQIKKIEKDKYEFEFQGYNVYQFPDSSFNLGNAELIASFDIHDGKTHFSRFNYYISTQQIETSTTLVTYDSGVKRHITIYNDKFSNYKLLNWKNYFFGVSFFSARQVHEKHFYLESDVIKITAKPNSSSDGMKNSVRPGEWLNLTHTAGTNNKYSFHICVVDPSEFSDSEYEITFRKINSELKINLKNLTAGKMIYTDEVIPIWEELPLFDGLALEVSYYDGNSKPFTENDVYRFSTKASTFDKNQLFADFNKINVFPNPFYGITNHNPIDGNKFVTFTHLPQRAVIKIFNISGQLVRIIEKDSPGKTVTWNFSNSDGWLVAGGMYVAYIELPEFGKTKILKLIVIPSTSIQPYF